MCVCERERVILGRPARSASTNTWPYGPTDKIPHTNTHTKQERAKTELLVYCLQANLQAAYWHSSTSFFINSCLPQHLALFWSKFIPFLSHFTNNSCWAVFDSEILIRKVVVFSCLIIAHQKISCFFLCANLKFYYYWVCGI